MRERERENLKGTAENFNLDQMSDLKYVPMDNVDSPYETPGRGSIKI